VVAGLVVGAICALAFSFRHHFYGNLHAGALSSKEVAPGVELKEADLFRGGSKSGRLYALYIDPNAVEPSIEINNGESAMANVAPDALAVVNAGFFTSERRATGLLVSQGKLLSPFIAEGGGAGSGVFVIDDGKPSLVMREHAKKGQFESAELALQAGPRIIEPDGSLGIRGDDGQRANRTAIGADKNGRVVVAVAVGPNGWSTGPTLFELQKLLARDLELSFALNLDGGPSTGLFVRGEKNVAIAESAPIHSALAWRKKP
jgi:exopolysaccharide biosynthesis protein